MCYKSDMIVWYRDNKDQDMELYQFLYSDFFFHLYSNKQLKTIRTDILTTYNPDRQQMTQKKLFTLSMYSCTENWPSSPFSKLSFSEVQNRVLVSFLVWAEAILSRPSVCSVLLKCHQSEHRRVVFFLRDVYITETRHFQQSYWVPLLITPCVNSLRLRLKLIQNRETCMSFHHLEEKSQIRF